MRPHAFVVPSLVASLLAASSALGAGDGVDVTWSAPQDCPIGAEVQQRISSRIPDASAQRVRVRGRVERASSSSWRLTLDIETPVSRGERTLEAATCDALASLAVVVIGMSIAPPPEAPAAAPPAATLAQVSPDRGPSPTAPSPSAARRLFVRGQLVTDVGTLPSAALGGGLAFGVRVFRDLSLEASVNLFAAEDATVEGTTRGASFTLLSTGVRGCWALTRRLEIAPCVGVAVDRLSATGFGAARVADASSLTWAPEALLAMGLSITGPFAVRAGLGAQAPMSRPSFVINATGTVHRADPVALRAWLGLEVRF